MEKNSVLVTVLRKKILPKNSSRQFWPSAA